ncbi:MAG TPA: sialidase family protein [Terriglobia bacterium]|nr:sialidase family protein [Terriglobia bacterium]
MMSTKCLKTVIRCSFRFAATLALAALALALFTAPAAIEAQDASPAITPNVIPVPLTQLSVDTFNNSSSQHATEVEPDTFSFGSTIVSVFQAGRFTDGGCSDIGFATSTDGGATWTNGFLPGITNIQGAGNPYDRISDPSVAYDSAHGEWIVASLPIVDAFKSIPAVIVSRSVDGINWDNPISVTGNVPSSDKDWIACDTTSSSPFYGNCYVEWDDPSSGDLIHMNTSTDGGLTWGATKNTANNSFGIGGQPVVQPDGTVVVPIEGNQMIAFRSTDGGQTWSSPVTISSISDHFEAGNLRSGPLPSAAVDGAGTVYVAWQDCRFRSKCAENDIVFSTSTDGLTWTSPSRIPEDPVTSSVDHFIPGIDVDKNTSGSTAHVGVTYYFYAKSNCTSSTCRLGAQFISSSNGGATWRAPLLLAGPMQLGWLPSTTLGQMVGDYISTSFVNGKAFGVFAVAKAKNGATFNEAMYTPTGGLSAPEGGARFSSALDRPVPGAHSDHGPRPEQGERGPHPPPGGRRLKKAARE